MSIQRWAPYEVVYTATGQRFTNPANAMADTDGPYVTYADHVAAVRAAYRRGYNDHARSQQHWQDTHGAYRAVQVTHYQPDSGGTA